ncbi:hypothetical protein [Rubrimonas cliftonensis]|uniref:Uncharacterized protein n=1 Tax=Rubrimonas cliftonensis TaxID=89524 RepID=A0A1H4DYB3_9RHOB|nr:hypothetical protein [Rubrimonas cliftonensis]SEA77182.1 hypothetical protein SAMN05444370_11186 [Rubrimonas cliftonensis]
MMEARRAATLSACATPDNLGALASGLSGASCPPGRVAARFAAATLATPAFVTGGNHVFGLCTETFRLQVSVHGADVVAPAWAGGAKSPDGACFHG